MNLKLELTKRVLKTGDKTPGNWNFTADIIEICASSMDDWAEREDSAMQIPGVLRVAVAHLRKCANKVFPECYDGCEAVKHLGVGECESVCPDKFKAQGETNAL